LTFRDLDGLADRLEIHDAASWRRGEAWFFITGHDVAVLAEWLGSDTAESPYRDDLDEVDLARRAKALASLRKFLEWYLENHMELALAARSGDGGV